MRSYQQYLDHLWQNQDPPDKVMQFAKGYEDYLQCPLQPLMDNLESQTYEVFEKDPFKYSQYQKAVLLALQDRVKGNDSKVVVVMVLGAGRGPLVTASMNAARKADIKIRVYAVEKNPNAVVTLENLKYEVWGDLVTVVSCDMRTWQSPEKADIIVSELLGSFGDNELSPECLDGADRFLKDDGISIPKNYTSFLAPLSSPKLWTETRNCKDQNKPAEAPFETPYVVKLHNMNVLDTAKPLFHFHHPNKVKEGTPDNNRYGVLHFNVEESVLLHGFAGYFECVLYEDLTLNHMVDFLVKHKLTDVEPTDKTYIAPMNKTYIGPQADADVGPMEKNYISPQADADVGPISLPPSDRC
ncbi:Protein arginine N-methyltransferase 5 [Lamellibrachia satsuma]|nr:Protein arginine N-methyltransferase 5 [Lamellibrachia satsuma]